MLPSVYAVRLRHSPKPLVLAQRWPVDNAIEKQPARQRQRFLQVLLRQGN